LTPGIYAEDEEISGQPRGGERSVQAIILRTLRTYMFCGQEFNFWKIQNYYSPYNNFVSIYRRGKPFKWLIIKLLEFKPLNVQLFQLRVSQNCFNTFIDGRLGLVSSGSHGYGSVFGHRELAFIDYNLLPVPHS
jgi:hypothetical protein